MPSAIVWTNRGSAGSDTDAFNAVFGSNASAARAVVDAALQTWQAIIPSFNFADGTNTFRVQVLMNAGDTTNGAESWYGSALDGQGRPEGGTIEIGAGPDGHGAGWFLDPTPGDSSEFGGGHPNAYAARATPGTPAASLYDLYTIVVHELTHTLGLNPDGRERLTANAGGYVTSTGAPDTVKSPGTLSTFAGPSGRVLLTSHDGSSELGAPDHVAPTGDNYTDPATGVTYAGTLDLMNPSYQAGMRLLPSAADVAVLRDVYGYTINTPAGFADSGPSTTSSTTAAGMLVTGADAGGGPHVVVTDGQGHPVLGFFAYDPHFTGGVRVATADLTGDGVPDVITGPGPSGGPDVRVFDGRTGQLVREFMAYAPQFHGGVYVAAGDVTGDGVPDIITAPDAGGGPDVRVFDGRTGQLAREFMAYDPHFLGGVRLAAGDANGDGRADIVTAPGAGGGPDVRLWDGRTGQLAREFMAYDPAFTGGVYVAAGDTNGDGRADLITGEGAGGAPLVRAYSGADGSLLHSFLAYDASFTGGVRVGAADVNGDGRADLLTTAGPGTGPIARAFDGASLAVLDNFYAYDYQFQGGVFVGG